MLLLSKKESDKVSTLHCAVLTFHKVRSAKNTVIGCCDHSVIEFLKSLQVLSPGARSLVIHENGQFKDME